MADPAPQPPPLPPPTVPSPSSREALRHGLAICAFALIVLALGYAVLRELDYLLRPLMVAVFLCYIIVPIHRRLVRIGLPSAISYIVIVGAVLLSMYATGTILYRGVSQLTVVMPTYLDRIDSLINQTVEDLRHRFSHFREDESESTAPTAQPSPVPAEPVVPAAIPAATATQPASAPADPLLADEAEVPRFPWLQLSGERLGSLGKTTLETFFGLFTGAVVVIFYMIFLLAEAAGFNRRVMNAFGEQRGLRIMAVVTKINNAVAEYLLVKTFVSLLTAILSVGVLLAFGIKFTLVWGLFTFFTNFIPYIGSVVAVILPVAMGFVQYGAAWQPVVLAGLLATVQNIIGSVLEPRMIGQKLDISPLMILLSLAFWGAIWGMPGMILSAPLVVTLKIVLENIEPTRPVARLMGNI